MKASTIFAIIKKEVMSTFYRTRDGQVEAADEFNLKMWHNDSDNVHKKFPRKGGEIESIDKIIRVIL